MEHVCQTHLAAVLAKQAQDPKSQCVVALYMICMMDSAGR